jgi:hypothetical protein
MLRGLPAIMAYLKCDEACLQAMIAQGLPVMIEGNRAITTVHAVDQWILECTKLDASSHQSDTAH